MKKFYFKWYLTIVISFLSSFVHSQLSVVASAGTTGPTLYTTLKDVFDAINAGTHTGAIIITINGNTTETASATLKKSSTGATSYTSVLIKPAAGTNPLISAAMANPVIILDGAMNVTIDGSNTVGGTTKNMTISNSNISSSANAIIFINGASVNVIKNAVIQSAVTNFGTITLSNSTTAAGNNNNTIENNDITKSPGGMPFAGIQNIGTAGIPNTGNIYRNNRVFDFSYFGFADGDDGNGVVGFSNNTLVEGNEFYNTASQFTPPIAIFIKNETGISNMTISKNKIHNLTTTAAGMDGILLYDAVSVTVVNNMISLSNSSSDIIGISQETGAGAVIKIYNNTVYISGTTSGTNSFAFFKNWFSTGDDIRNNIFVNTRVNDTGPKGQYAFVKLNTGSFTSNYNDLVSIGNTNNYVGYINTGSNPIYYTTLAQWQAGTSQDANSISINPAFVSATDLHLDPANCGIDNKGTPIAGINSDIDGNTRNATTPDIGADEFTSIVTPTTIITQPLSVNTCLQQSATFTVVASGSGILTYQWKKDANNIPGANSATYTVSNVVAGDAGNYSVVVTSSCESITSNNAALTVSGICTSVQAVDASIDSIILKPNPVYNATTLCVYAKRIMKITWRIVDMNGRVVMVLNNQVYAGKNDIQLKLDGLAAATYCIMGQTSKGRTQVVRLIKL